MCASPFPPRCWSSPSPLSPRRFAHHRRHTPVPAIPVVHHWRGRGLGGGEDGEEVRPEEHDGLARDLDGDVQLHVAARGVVRNLNVGEDASERVVCSAATSVVSARFGGFGDLGALISGGGSTALGALPQRARHRRRHARASPRSLHAPLSTLIHGGGGTALGEDGARRRGGGRAKVAGAQRAKHAHRLRWSRRQPEGGAGVGTEPSSGWAKAVAPVAGGWERRRVQWEWR